MLRIEDKMYPEMMSEKQLAAAFRDIEEQVNREVAACIRDRKMWLKILEKLAVSERVQYRCAIMRRLAENAQNIGSEGRQFFLPHIIGLLSDEYGIVQDGAINCAGNLIAAEFEENPGVWAESLRRILFVGKDSGVTQMSRIRAGNALKGLLETVYRIVPEEHKKQVTAMYCGYFKSTKWDGVSCVSLLKGIMGMPYKVWGTMQRGNIVGFVRYFLKNDTGEIRLSALLVLYQWLIKGWKPSRDFAEYLQNALEAAEKETAGEKGALAFQYISMRIRGLLAPGSVRFDAENYSDEVLYRENVDSGVSVAVKWINLLILRDKYSHVDEEDYSGYGSHLVVFMRLNTEAILFKQAGDDLLQFIDSLHENQKRQIMAELFKCVELSDDSSHYLPYLIGECWFRTPLSMQLDLVPEIYRIYNSEYPDTVEILMGMACEILKRFAAPDFACASAEEQETAQQIRQSMSGMLCQGIYSDRRIVGENTVYTIGFDLFRTLDGSIPASPENVSGQDGSLLDMAREPLVSVARSVLSYLRETERLDPIYICLPVREISRYLTQIGGTYADPKRPVAFFSGSFDPFSNGHRAVAREIAEMGFQVFVSVDDFSWTRITQPTNMRRKIIKLSIADLAHVRIFPQELSVNPENPADLERLRSLFPGRDVYLVCGSDRVETAEVYQKDPTEGSIHSFPHIIFTRNESYQGVADCSDILTGEVIYLKLPVYYEHMTSQEIRRNIQEGRSIDGLVTIPAGQYIRRLKLYTDERIYKKEVETRQIETVTEFGDGQVRILLMDEYSGETLGELLAQFGSTCLSRDLEIVSLSYLDDPDGTQPGMLLDEALLEFQAHGFETVYAMDSLCDKRLLKERGFIRISGTADRLYTDLRSPLVLFGDAASSVLEPFAGDPSLTEVMKENQRNLRMGMAGLYPGNAVLFLDVGILNDRMVQKIRKRCGLPARKTEEIEETAERICVSFGNIFRHVQIPGVISMSLETERVYEQDLQSSEIREINGYPELPIQINSLKSVDRTFVLVDDFYHNGYWLQIIEQGLNEHSLQEDELIVGAVSGKGQALARKNGLKVDAVYEIPNMKAWIRESEMIPFYAGNKVLQDEETQGFSDEAMNGRLPSIYPMLPYQMPPFLRDASFHAVYDMSMICLENARRLFTELENLYEARYYRRLTLERLGEVIDDPGCTETAAYSHNAEKQEISALLNQEILRLRRLHV